MSEQASQGRPLTWQAFLSSALSRRDSFSRLVMMIMVAMLLRSLP